MSLYGSVWRDAEMGVLRMWYRSGNRAGEADWKNNTLICHAVSADGIHWEKPDIGVYNYWGSYANNIVCRPHYNSDDECGRYDSLNVILDPDDTDPEKRCKMMSFQYAVPGKYMAGQRWPSGYYPAFSSDGFHWREEEKPVLEFIEGGFGDTLTLMHDTKRRRYVCFCKILTPEYGNLMRYRGSNENRQVWNGKKWIPFEGENPVKRMRGMIESEDFLEWSEPRFIFPTDDEDPPDVQFYNNSGFPYESMYLGFLDIYHVDTSGTIDIQLVHSRDGDSWERCFDRTPILLTGRENSDWDYGCHAMAGSPPIRMGDRLLFFYASGSMRHGGGNLKVPRAPGNRRLVGLATLRLDGFVSLDAGKSGGTAVTPPLTFTHSALAVNADAQGGEFRAQVLSGGKPLEGYDLGSCDPVRSDSVRAFVTWKGKRLPSTGKPLQLQFELKNGSLYSFWCEPLTERNV